MPGGIEQARELLLRKQVAEGNMIEPHRIMNYAKQVNREQLLLYYNKGNRIPGKLTGSGLPLNS